jgi:hypothetical protein
MDEEARICDRIRRRVLYQIETFYFDCLPIRQNREVVNHFLTTLYLHRKAMARTIAILARTNAPGRNGCGKLLIDNISELRTPKLYPGGVNNATSEAHNYPVPQARPRFYDMSQIFCAGLEETAGGWMYTGCPRSLKYQGHGPIETISK